ncbi:MAG: hypothetical protein WDZ35_04970 [Crocinitomicaceae bacterium]
MKKLIVISFVAAATLLISSFSNTSEITNDNQSEVTNSDVWKYMKEDVFVKLNALVNYDETRMFSRCPSGFSQYIDEEVSDNKMIYGNITFAQGCAHEDFCFYKLNWEKKETLLKKTEEAEYVAVDDFVKTQKPAVARI